MLFGEAGNDLLSGSDGDVLKGGDGFDIFYGDENGGLVVAYGEGDNDEFNLRDGAIMIMEGGEGADDFVVYQDWHGIGYINDFDIVNDAIELDLFWPSSVTIFQDEQGHAAMSFPGGGEIHFNNIAYSPNLDFNFEQTP